MWARMVPVPSAIGPASPHTYRPTCNTRRAASRPRTAWPVAASTFEERARLSPTAQVKFLYGSVQVRARKLQAQNCIPYRDTTHEHAHVTNRQECHVLSGTKHSANTTSPPRRFTQTVDSVAAVDSCSRVSARCESGRCWPPCALSWFRHRRSSARGVARRGQLTRCRSSGTVSIGETTPPARTPRRELESPSQRSRKPNSLRVSLRLPFLDFGFCLSWLVAFYALSDTLPRLLSNCLVVWRDLKLVHPYT